MTIGKISRSERLILLMKMLAERPGEPLSLTALTDQFEAAKSTISEDLSFIKGVLETGGSGLLQTHTGAIGGVQYWPLPSQDEAQVVLKQLCRMLQDPARILPGGFVYMTDVLTHPAWTARIGEILAARFLASRADAVLTVETKGIPLALMVARALGVPMIMARREGRVTEGSAFSIHYISGSTRRISTMTVGLRALRRDSRILVVDDFMKAGATARAMVDMVSELGAHVAGVGVFVTTAEPHRKRVEGFVSLLTLEAVDEDGKFVRICPAPETW